MAWRRPPLPLCIFFFLHFHIYRRASTVTAVYTSWLDTRGVYEVYITVWKWHDNISLLSNIIPKSRTTDDRGTLSWPILWLKVIGILFLEKVMQLHFCTFTNISLSWHHVEKRFTQSWSFSQWFEFSTARNILRSSAYSKTLTWGTAITISLINIINNNGPNMLPCGTPEKLQKGPEKVFPIFTLMQRFSR